MFDLKTCLHKEGVKTPSLCRQYVFFETDICGQDIDEIDEKKQRQAGSNDY